MLTKDEAQELIDDICSRHIHCMHVDSLESAIRNFTEKEEPKDESVNKIEENIRRFFEVDESIRITKIDLLDGWQWANSAELETKVNEIATSFNALIKRLQKMGCIGIHGE